VPEGLSNVTAIAAGEKHCLALKGDGTVVNWGKYRNDDVLAGVVMPFPAGLSNVIAIAAGDNHDVLLKRDGTVFTWGWNGWSQTNLPPEITNVAGVGATGDDSLVILSNGTVVCWGRDNYNQTQVPTSLTNAASVCGGPDHILAIRKNGMVAAWGSNASGQTSLPAGLTNVMALAAGQQFSLALVGGAASSPDFTLSNPIRGAGSFSVSVSTVSGKSYSLEYKDALTNANWTGLPSVAGDGSVKTLTDSGASGTARLYRVRQF
jgi:alpha-tubulin suppressor-like RCC1 family protein